MKLKGIFTHTTTISKVFQFLLIMLITTLLAIGLWGICGGNQSTASLKWLQFLQTVGVFLLPCFLSAYLWSTKPLNYLHLTTTPTWLSALLTIAMMIIALPCINLLGYWNQQLTLPDFLQPLEEIMKQQEEAAAALTERFIRADNFGILIINILLMAVLPAFSEEICFRSILMNLFMRTKDKGKKTEDAQRMANGKWRMTHTAIWASAFIFSFIHFQFYGFLPRMLMGALFGYLLVWSGTLWLPILAHFTNNAMAVILYNIYHTQGLDPTSADTLGTADTLWLGILSSILVIGCAYLLYNLLSKGRIKD